VIELEPQARGRALEDLPPCEPTYDAFDEAIVETEPLGDARGADRVRRTEDDSDHPPLRPVELDTHREVLKPVSANLGCVVRNHLGRYGVIAGEAAVPGFCSRYVRCESPSHNFIIAWSSISPLKISALEQRRATSDLISFERASYLPALQNVQNSGARSFSDRPHRFRFAFVELPRADCRSSDGNDSHETS